MRKIGSAQQLFLTLHSDDGNFQRFLIMGWLGRICNRLDDSIVLFFDSFYPYIMLALLLDHMGIF